MRTKQFSFTIALALGMLVMFMLPMVAWEGTGNTAQAQEPDVGLAAVPQMTVGISQTAFEVASTGVSTIYLESTEQITVTNILFDLDIPDNIVQLQGRPYALPISTTTLAVTRTGNIVGYNQTGNRISFQWDFPISTGLLITPNEKVAIVAIPWSGTQVGQGNVSIESADIDTFGTSFHGQPGATLDGIVDVIRRQTYLRLDGPTCGTRGLLLNQSSTGVTNTVVALTADWITGANFELVYDSNVLEVVNVNVTGMNGAADTSIAGVIRFEGLTNRPTDFNNQQVLEVVWRGLDTGSATPSLRNAVLLDEDGNNLATPGLLFGDRTNGAIGPICDTIVVAPPPAELYFEDASLNVNAGSTANQDVRIEGVSNICEVIYRVEFDPNVVQVEDADPSRTGVQVGIGDLFGTSINVTENEVNNADGTIDFRVRSSTALNALGTSGQISEITWKGLTGATDLEFVQHSIFDCNNANVAHSIRADSDPGSITVNGIIISISGQVQDNSGAALANVTVSAGGSNTATTDSSGNYTISSLADGSSYTVTPSLSGYTFSPANRNVAISGADKTGVDFTGTPDDTYSISGTVQDNNGAALANVTVSAGGSNTATTDSSGNYTISGLADGSSYTVTPSLSGYTFSPANQNVAISGADKTGVDFTGTITPPDGLTVSPTSLTFNGTDGQPDPAAQTINITTSGSWTASASVTNGGDWLTVDPTSGSGNGTVNVRTNLSELAVGTYNGTVTVTAGSDSETVNVTLNVTTVDGAISGQIRALGRTTNGQPDHSGIQIYVSDLTCVDFSVTNATPDFTTSADGRFSITVNSTVRCLRAFRDGHLSGQRTNPSGNLGLLELPGGDIIQNDDKIDIFDLARAGNQYQQPNPDPLVDFDSDGDVDIFDLGIIATNFGQSGPVDDWR